MTGLTTNKTNEATNCSDYTTDTPPPLPNIKPKYQIKDRFRNNKLHWDQIPRANNHNKPLQEKAVNLLSTIVHKLRKTEVITLNHNYLSRITKCEKDQNVNLLKQLADILDISFHVKITIKGTIYRNCYVIKHTERGRAIIEDRKVLLSQKHFIGKKAVIPTKTMGKGSKKESACAEFPPSSYIYKEELFNNNRSSAKKRKSNFLENSLEEVEGGNNEHTTTNSLDSKTERCKQKPEDAGIDSESEEQNKQKADKKKKSLTSKIVSFFRQPRNLKDFHPLSEEDCSILQSASGREFSRTAMNEILLDMSKRLSDRNFNSKKGFMAYMAKVFAYEKRDAIKINSENFKIRNNQTQDEKLEKQQEKYLREIEYSLQVSPEWHLKKKLASVFAREKAYQLLKAYKSINQRGSQITIILNKPVELTKLEIEIIEKQVRASHERVGEDGSYEPIDEIKIIMPEVAKEQNHQINQEKTNIQGKEEESKERAGIWGQIRTALAKSFGSEGELIDKNWLTKLEARVDETSKTINLKAPSNFVKSFVESRYLSNIEQIVKTTGFQLQPIEC